MKCYNIICENAVEENNIIYFAGFHGFGLYSYHKDTQETKYLGSIPKQNNNKIRLYEAIIKLNSKLILAPSGGTSSLVIFDLDSKEFKLIDLGIGNTEAFKFNAIIPYGNCVYLIGQALHVILKVNIDNSKVETIYSFDDSGDWMCINGIVKGNYAYIPFVEHSAFLVLNLETSETKIVNYNSSIKSCCGMVDGNNNDLWLVGLNEPFLINVDLDGNVLKEVEIDSLKDFKAPYGLFENPTKEGKYIYLFPLGVRSVYCFNIESGNYKICKEFSAITESAFSNPNNCRLLSFQARKNYVYLVECNSKIWHEINLSNRTYNSFEVKQDPKIVYNNWKYGMIENNNYKLVDLFDVLR